MSWKVKKSEEKGKRRCSDYEVDCCSMRRNIKAVVEEHLSSENVIYLARYLLINSTGRYDHDDEVAMYLLTYHQQTN